MSKKKIQHSIKTHKHNK